MALQPGRREEVSVSVSEPGPEPGPLPLPELLLPFGWGANGYGQLGLGHKEDVLLPQQLKDFCPSRRLGSLTGGGGHSAVVTACGDLFVCGLNKDGQLGLGHLEEVLTFTPCPALFGRGVSQVACGWDFTIILAGNGQVLCCGSNSFGQLGVSQGTARCIVPQVIETLKEKVVHVAAGLRHALAATDRGLVFQWGTGMASQAKRASPGASVPPFLTSKEPCRVTGLDNVKVIRVIAGSYHSVALTDKGNLYVWGSNKHGQLVNKDAFLPSPQKIEEHHFSSEKIVTVWSGWTHMVAQTETGKVFTWGRADYGQLGRNWKVQEEWKKKEPDESPPYKDFSKMVPVPVPDLTGASEIACGSEHNLAVTGGQCFSWGWNEHGMCGDGSEESVWAPRPVGALGPAEPIRVGCGAGHSLALCRLPGGTTKLEREPH
ncbi:secretion-regulating guanine nucleotide exchange factor isoform X2 [Tachyglossus aculeatus]|uniref:secretion-regulating guanine nucleotide exchange factor isoform X2 n=1 Tax=Tachyglossus aculeatus TaxID=9261 RepID=UPI0018F46891|nr:secretion-regulating guanine nucleotide exchange factor isoform X2 [Tachyglossus aculeatus]